MYPYELYQQVTDYVVNDGNVIIEKLSERIGNESAISNQQNCARI